MHIDKKVVSAKFIKRHNRFQAFVELDKEELVVHVPNTGRCKEILIPGTEVILREEKGENRKTAYDLIAGYKDGKLINIDSQIPNKVVHEALMNKKIKSLTNYKIIEREKTFGNSRFDFKLSNSPLDEYYLEVKGVTYEYEGLAKFPDAPTDRGRKHLMELVEAKKNNIGAGVLFLVQLSDVTGFSPYDEMDKPFGEALRYAKSMGVDLFCYESSVDKNHITLNKEVEIIL